MTENVSEMAAGLAPGAIVAGYRIERQIGAGGMAVVFRAHDERLRRPVALKVMSRAAASDEGFRQRFILESQAAAAVDDPHIIPVYEAGEADGTLFIAMRYVAGGDVHSLVSRAGPLSAPHALAIISPVASALDAAHAAGLVHRDVKPANMLLDVRPGRPDHVYLSDFGLSKGALASHGLTAAGQFLGTPDYTSPEQMQARPTDGRADQYSLACSAFELLTGAPPFPRDQITAVIWAHMSEPPPHLAARRPGLAAAADAVLGRALAKPPEHRYATCREFADALRGALGLPPYRSGSGLAPAPGPAAASPGRHSAARHARAGSGAAARLRPEPEPEGAGRPVPESSRRNVLLGGAAAMAVAAAGGAAWGLTRATGTARTGKPTSGHATTPGAAVTGFGAVPPAGRPGSVIWRAGAGSLQSVWLRLIVGGGAVYLQGLDTISAVSTAGGRPLWTFTAHGDNRLIYGIAATPAALYQASTNGGQAGVSAVEPARGTALWSFPMLAEGLAVADGRVLACGEQGGSPGLYALDAASGRQIWKFPATVIGTPAVSGGIAYAIGEAGSSYRLYGVTAATGQPLASQPADWTDKPAVADGTTVCIVSQSSSALWVWPAGTDKPAWTSDADGGIVSATVAAGVVYAVTRNGNLLALDAASRKLIWQQPSSTVLTPAVADGVVYAGTPRDGMVARQVSDGRQLWESSPGYFTTSPVVAGGIVYAAGQGSIYALRA